MTLRVLLDECLPRKLSALLEGEFVTTVPKRGWASKTNGELLALASPEFDVFVTHDENLEHRNSSGQPQHSPQEHLIERLLLFCAD